MSFLDKLTDVASSTVDKAGDVIETTKIKTKISGLEKDRDKNLLKIGEVYAELAKNGTELIPEVKAYFDEILSLEEQISKLRDELK